MMAISRTWVEVLTSWVKSTCCDYAKAHSECFHIPFDSVAFDVRSIRASNCAWSGLLDKLLDMLSKARSVSRLELHEAERCHMAAGEWPSIGLSTACLNMCSLACRR